LPALGVLVACQGVPMSEEALREAVGHNPRLESSRRAAVDPPEQRALRERALRNHFVRARLQDARAFRAQDRLEAAERALRDVLEADPDHARAHRLLAVVLEEQGRTREAALYRARADVLDPPAPPLPDGPLEGTAAGVLVALLDPVSERNARRGEAAEWVASVTRHLRLRLPGAWILRTAPETVPAIRAWFDSLDPSAVLSVRVEAARCGETTKDGAFALAKLRAVAALPDGTRVAVHTVRELRFDPSDAEDCVETVLARALEQVLALPDVREALAGHGDAPHLWASAQIRALYPALGEAIEEEIQRGLDQLSTGRVAAAETSFQRAQEIDPEDPHVQAYLAEAEATLAMLKELPPVGAGRPGSARGAAGVLDPQLTPERRAALERRLATEKRRRAELVARLKISEAEARVPSREALALLRPVALPGPDAAGPRIVRRRTAEPIEARALYGDRGEIQMRFYFADGGSLPVLREDDRDGDGRPDRWTGYAGIIRHDLWEDALGTGMPDVRWVFRDDGTEVERIEIDRDFDGRLERVLRYAAGTLVAEENDTNGDGSVDRIERFDARGDVELLEEDVNGDGRFDIRTRFRNGKLVSREIWDPDHVEGPLQRDVWVELPSELPPVSSDRLHN
ncbi:MAG: tetratricopeptide repeat protein, partial [Deltaproteobacteria bacterium]